MKVQEKYKSIKDNLLKLHVKQNILDSNEYNKKLKEFEDSIKQSPNKLEEATKLEMSLIMPISNSVGRIRQVMFRTKSKENESENAKNLVIKLNQEKKAIEKAKISRARQEQIRLSKVNILISFLGNWKAGTLQKSARSRNEEKD